MKEKLMRLSELARTTVGASCSLVIMKTGGFKVQFTQEQNQYPFPEQRDPEKAIDLAIEHIENKRQPLVYNPQNKMSVALGSTHSMKKIQLV